MLPDAKTLNNHLLSGSVVRCCGGVTVYSVQPCIKIKFAQTRNPPYQLSPKLKTISNLNDQY